jgi:hypothetical protein
MNSKRGLMAVLVGLAMLATPLTAAAKDYHHYDSHAARVEARALNASAHSFAATRNYDRAVRNDAAAYRAYGYRGYAAPGYVGAPYYGGGYGGGGYGGGGYAGGNGCGSAQRVMNTYYRDRNTGHPAAAYDLLARNRWAFNSGCAGAAPVGGGLFGGGVPAYSNYGGNGLLGGLFGGSPAAYSNYRPAYNGGGYNGGGYGQPYRSNGLLGGLFGGSPAANTNYRPAYNGAGYNGGYGQPNGGGSGLGSLMQYIR